MSLFHVRTTVPISTKFCTDHQTNSGKVLFTTVSLPTQHPNPGVPQAPEHPPLGDLDSPIKDYKMNINQENFNEITKRMTPKNWMVHI